MVKLKLNQASAKSHRLYADKKEILKKTKNLQKDLYRLLYLMFAHDNQNKSFKTKNLEIKCSAVPGMNGNFFGSCRIRVSKDSVENLGPRQDYLFGVLDKEATEVLSNFNKFPDNFLLVYGDGTGDFRLEANWKKNTFAFLLNHDFVTTD